MSQIPYNRRAAYKGPSNGRSKAPSESPVPFILGFGTLLILMYGVAGGLLLGDRPERQPTVGELPARRVAAEPTKASAPPETITVQAFHEVKAPAAKADKPKAPAPPTHASASRVERDDSGPEPSQRRRSRSHGPAAAPLKTRWTERYASPSEPKPHDVGIQPDPGWEPYPPFDEDAEDAERELRRLRLMVQDYLDRPSIRRIVVRDRSDAPVHLRIEARDRFPDSDPHRVIVVRRAPDGPFEMEPIRRPEPAPRRVMVLRRSPCGPAGEVVILPGPPIERIPPPPNRLRYREVGEW